MARDSSDVVNPQARPGETGAERDDRHSQARPGETGAERDDRHSQARPGETGAERDDRHSQARPGETEAERDDRNLIELLQELRVAGLGVQVLFGFLLSLPFTNRFVKLSSPQRGLYVATLLLAAISTALLLGPVAYHRLVFRRRQKERLVKDANLMALGGLAAVGLAISAAVLLVVSFVDQGLPTVIITAFTVCLFVCVWLVLPLVRSRGRSNRQ